jgi:predicted GIY-YIG superfamily endonuclease
MTDKQGYVYILECEDACWYVGYSQDLSVRIASHFLGAGSLWTQAHKPISVYSVQKGDTTVETCQTIALMCKHGFEKVRGGSYCNVVMKRPTCISKAMHYASYKTPKPITDTTDEDSIELDGT